eukprot:TRINITY_DN4940_c0_g1_i3.p1 TRINITY_DN4940_c0_g1~~TRINITY_DN4940_c0_g1_i3.p1  ORF type:complete len:276 (+),score=56.57 TRINITY_DN4940_c0_g1_i3:22-849(+)
MSRCLVLCGSVLVFFGMVGFLVNQFFFCVFFFFFFQAEDGIRDVERSRGLGDVYKRQIQEGYKMKDTFTEGLENVMDNLYKGGAFLTTSNGTKNNTMTISWGSVGYMWGKPMFMALVRTSRYSNELLRDGFEYTISIPFNKEMSQALSICGTKSGKEFDKEKEANIKFTASKKVSVPVVDGCDQYFECRIVFKQEMDLNNLDEGIRMACYEKDAKHILYFGEIVEQYTCLLYTSDAADDTPCVDLGGRRIIKKKKKQKHLKLQFTIRYRYDQDRK